MTFGIIDRNSHKYYTYMKDVFSAINGAQRDYNWLITDCECYPQNSEIEQLLEKEYCWLSGDELTDIIEKENFQWIWGILCGFERDVTLEEILKYPLPCVQKYSGYYSNPVRLQHPLSTVEIVPCDSSHTLIISKDKNITDSYLKCCPKAEDLFLYNQK